MIRKYLPLAIVLALTAGCIAPTASSEETGTEAEPLQTDIGSLSELGLCLDVAGFNNNIGFRSLEMWDCNGLINQQWTWEWETHHIISKWNGKCLASLIRINENAYNSIGMEDCDPTIPEQGWSPQQSGKIIHDVDGRVLRRQWWHHTVTSPDVYGWTNRFETAVYLGGPNDSDWQTWERWAWRH